MIAHDFGGGPVGVRTIAIAIGEEVWTVEEVYERYLIQIGFIKRTPQGRDITEAGRGHVEGGVRFRCGKYTMQDKGWRQNVRFS